MVNKQKGKEMAVNQKTPSRLQHKSGRKTEAKKQSKAKEQTVVTKVKSSQKLMTSKAPPLQVSSRPSTHQKSSSTMTVHPAIGCNCFSQIGCTIPYQTPHYTNSIQFNYPSFSGTTWFNSPHAQ
jgi:hypothetical protein